VSFLRWDPFGHREDAAELSRAYASKDHSVFQVRDIARTVFEASLEAHPKGIDPGLATLLHSTATAFRLYAARLEGEELNLDSAIASIRESRRESLGSIRKADDTGVWLASGCVLSNIERMVEQLEGSAPALQLTPTKSPPDHRLGLRRHRSKRRERTKPSQRQIW